MPVQAAALVSLLMAAPPPGAGGAPIERVAAPCHIMIDGECKVERKPAAVTPPRAGPKPAPAATLEGAVSYFTWTYDFQPEPGQRTWSRSGNRWSERYPSGEVKKVFDTIAAGKVQGCQGQVVSHSADPAFEVFIPNKGCPGMMALFRRGTGSWNGLGEMRNIR